ncbi:MAG TPA: ATP-binding cassette domain-containing protein, partial [Streptosporangiaceae bacterium]|nr:ATP-binding cassette domain-containing protein [Streptosporangiaceae bacterium]
MNSSDILISVRGLCVDYGLGDEAVHAVVDADLELRRGETLGLAGESGSGKSTLAYAITRLLRPPGVITAGSAYFGSSVNLLTAGQRELRGLRWNEIAVVLQSSMNALNPVLSIGTQFSDVLRAHRPDMSRADRRARSGELLEMVGIPADRQAWRMGSAAAVKDASDGQRGSVSADGDSDGRSTSGGELTVPVLEKQVHSQDRGLAALMHAARRVGARLNHATKFRAPAWLPSVEESEQLA